MSQDEIKAAIAEQEEYLKRMRSCRGQLGLPHRFASFDVKGQRSEADDRPGAWRECIACGATQTDEDYHLMLTSRN